MEPKLTPELTLMAYANGYFPMANPEDNNSIYWYSPDPRAIIPLDTFYVPNNLKRLIARDRFDIRFDTDFESVIRACADRDETWISEEIIMVYMDLHRLGFAHSVETWFENKLAGGLYGVGLGGAFFGESMFHHVRDASKVALVALVDRLKQKKFTLLDTQYTTPHLEQFGVREIPRSQYLDLLYHSLEQKVVW